MTSAVAPAAAAVAPSSVKKTSPSKSKKAGPTAHPRYSEMVIAAVTALKERNGSSKHAILKYILAQYPVPAHDPRSVNNNINMSLRAMIKNGALRHAKATSLGASGRFKLGEKKPKTKKAAGAVRPKSVKPKSASVKPKSAHTKKAKKLAAVKKPKISESAVAPQVAAAPKVEVAKSPKKVVRKSPKQVVRKSPKQVVRKSTKKVAQKSPKKAAKKAQAGKV